MASPSRRNNSSSLRRALAILDELVASPACDHGASLADLAEAVGASKSTMLRLLTPLLEQSLVERRPDGRYAIGVGAVRLGTTYLNGLDLRSVAHPVLVDLAQTTAETVHLLIYNAAEVVYVDKIAGPTSIQMASRVGDRADVHSTAAGKAMLAYLPARELDNVVARGLPAHTARTLTTADELALHLELVRDRGYGVDDVENEPDIRCVAAPVFDHTDAVVAAVSVSGPANRMAARIEDLAPQVMAAARTVSLRLGSHSADGPTPPQ